MKKIILFGLFVFAVFLGSLNVKAVSERSLEANNISLELASMAKQEIPSDLEEGELLYQDDELSFYDNGVVVDEEGSYRLSLADALKIAELIK